MGLMDSIVAGNPVPKRNRRPAPTYTPTFNQIDQGGAAPTYTAPYTPSTSYVAAPAVIAAAVEEATSAAPRAIAPRPQPSAEKKERRTKTLLRRAVADAQKGGASLSGPLTEGQRIFGETLAKKTGLSPRVIGAWELAENSDSNAVQKDAEGYHNWLNIGPFTQDPRFNDPKTAAKATAKFLAGKDNSPAGGFAFPDQILPAAGRSDEEQMQAIENSAWSATGYGAGATLDGTYALVDGKTRPRNPVPKPLVRRAKNVLGKQTTQRIMGSGSASPKPTKVPSLIKIGKKAERKFDVEAREQPFFDPVDPVHSTNSMHYSGNAIDFQGDAEQLGDLNQWLAKRYGSETAEMFYDPGINIADGSETGAIGGHGSHVHFGLDPENVGAKASSVFGVGAPTSGGSTGGTGLAPTGTGSVSAEVSAALSGIRDARAQSARPGQALKQLGFSASAPRPKQPGEEDEEEIDPLTGLPIEKRYAPRRRRG